MRDIKSINPFRLIIRVLNDHTKSSQLKNLSQLPQNSKSMSALEESLSENPPW